MYQTFSKPCFIIAISRFIKFWDRSFR